MLTYKALTVSDFDFINADNWIGAPKSLVAKTAGKEIALKTDFVLLKSERFLYLKIEVEDVNPGSTMTEYNQPLYEEEVVEFFLSPDGGLDRYFEFEINHKNAVFVAWIDHKNGNKISFIDKNPAKTVITTTKKGWTALARLPLSLFGDIKNGTFNVYRIKRTSSNAMILSAFSPTNRENFHMPECFAKLI
jgi:hypothetical protein